jgi:hypothetical protein
MSPEEKIEYAPFEVRIHPRRLRAVRGHEMGEHSPVFRSHAAFARMQGGVLPAGEGEVR